MVFDLLSFLFGVAAGALTGALAGTLRSLERTADLQERIRSISQEMSSIKDLMGKGSVEKSQLDELDKDLEEIHEEIRRMYKKTTR